MRDLTLTQEYLLCAMNKKGKIGFGEQDIGLVVSSLIELIHGEFVKIEDERMIIAKDLTSDYIHLSSVYEFITNNKPMKIKTAGEKLWFTSKNVKILLSDVKNSLMDNDCLTEKEAKTMFQHRTEIVVKENCVDAVIQKIRAEMLEDVEIDENTIALISLFHKTGILKNYFSKYEADQLKEKLKQIKREPKYKLIAEIIDHVEALFVAVIL